MKIGKLAAAAAVLSLTATPALAQASSADLSVANVQRDGGLFDSESDLAGSNVLIGIAIVAAIIGAIVVVADDDDLRVRVLLVASSVPWPRVALALPCDASQCPAALLAERRSLSSVGYGRSLHPERDAADPAGRASGHARHVRGLDGHSRTVPTLQHRGAPRAAELSVLDGRDSSLASQPESR